MSDPIPIPIEQWIAQKLVVIEQKVDGIVERTITVEQADSLIAALHDVKEKMSKLGQ